MTDPRIHVMNKRWLLSALIVALLVALGWWYQRQTPPQITVSHEDVKSPPSIRPRAPDIVGKVESIKWRTPEKVRCLVGGPGGPIDVWWVDIPKDTPIRGSTGSSRDIEVGQIISVWTTGNVFETDPPIVIAKWVLIEASPLKPETAKAPHD